MSEYESVIYIPRTLSVADMVEAVELVPANTATSFVPGAASPDQLAPAAQVESSEAPLSQSKPCMAVPENVQVLLAVLVELYTVMDESA